MHRDRARAERLDHETEFREFRCDLAHRLAGQPHPRGDVLKRNPGEVERGREDGGAARRCERTEQRHVAGIDEPRREDAHAF